MRRGPCVHGKTRQLRRRRWGEKSILRRSLLNGQWLRLLSWHNRYCGEADYICNDDPLHSHVLRIRGLRPIFTHVTLFLLVSLCKRSIYHASGVSDSILSVMLFTLKAWMQWMKRSWNTCIHPFRKHFICRPSFVFLKLFIFTFFDIFRFSKNFC